VILTPDGNMGVGNIGVGELHQLITVSNSVDFLKYDKVVYLTGRKLIANPWIFEKAIAMKKDALISNPPFLIVNSLSVSPPTDRLYNDMFFAMRSWLMLEYVRYSATRLRLNMEKRIGSEQNLYTFINDRKIDYEWLESLGMLRIDYRAGGELQLI
jgi:hypothetical protein